MTEQKSSTDEMIPIHIEFLLDDSFSMSFYQKDTLNGFNKFIEIQKQETEAKYTTCTLNLFSINVITEYDTMRMDEIPLLRTYNPTGNGTALYKSIKDVSEKLTKQLEGREGKEPKVIIVIFTDGKDNLSHLDNISSDDIKNLVQKKSEWTWMYMGAVLNPKEEAEKIGITIYKGFNQDKNKINENNGAVLFSGTENGMITLGREISSFSQTLRNS